MAHVLEHRTSSFFHRRLPMIGRCCLELGPKARVSFGFTRQFSLTVVCLRVPSSHVLLTWVTCRLDCIQMLGRRSLQVNCHRALYFCFHPSEDRLSAGRGRFASLTVESVSYRLHQRIPPCWRPSKGPRSLRHSCCSPYLRAASVSTSLLTVYQGPLNCGLFLCFRGSFLARGKDIQRQIVTKVFSAVG